jgi:hypothetical protein
MTRSESFEDSTFCPSSWRRAHHMERRNEIEKVKGGPLVALVKPT